MARAALFSRRSKERTSTSRRRSMSALLVAIVAVFSASTAGAQFVNWAWLDVPAGQPTLGRAPTAMHTVTTGLLRLPDGALVASTFERQFFRSTDDGLNWTRTDPGLGPIVWREKVPLVLHRGPSGTIYAVGDGLFRSTDDGASWERMNELGHWWTISILELPSGELLTAAYGDYVHRSTDKGVTWSRSSTGIPRESRWTHGLSVDSSGVVYLGADWGAFRSTDNGMTWSNMIESLAPWRWFLYIAVAPDGSLLMAGANEPGVYRSTDHGVTWKLAGWLGDPGPGLNILGINRDGIIFGSSGFPEVGGSGALRSTDGGTTFTSISNYGIRAISFGSGEDIVASFGAAGVQRSTDSGASWQLMRTRAMSTPVTALGFDGAGRLYSGSDDGVRPSADSGTRWLPLGTGLPGGRVNAIAAAPAGVFAGVDSGLYRSLDSGRSWNRVTIPNTSAVTALYTEPNATLVGTADGHVYRVTEGDSWTTLTADASGAVTSLLSTASAVVVAIVAGELHLGSANIPWRTVPRDSVGVVRSIALDSLGVVYAGTDKGLFASLDDGATWSRGNPEEDLAVDHVAADHRYGVIVSTRQGTYYHRTNLPFWFQLQEAPRGWRPTVLVTGFSGVMFAGSDSGGVRSGNYDYYRVGVETTESGAATTVTCSPNPLTGMGMVCIGSDRGGAHVVDIVDAMGRKIARLFSGVLTAGEHRIVINGNDLPAGVCFVRATGPGGVTTTPVVNVH